MRSMLEKVVLFVVLVFYWFTLGVPMAALNLGIEIILVTFRAIEKTSRLVVEDFETTREIGKL